ncbi:MAG TPA: SusD/RagB family nutrient-binding outer membrane lipoprotein [Longimicrobiaceae bacterium]|nr:SusD/RagB family nutrient-binding outer membrane lipoprotein [Longimicrobiaceae bacterium]
MTNRSWILRGAAVVGCAAVLGGCDAGLTELNVNPNEPVDVGAEYLFPNAVEAAVSRALGASLSMDMTALWVQHLAESRYSEEDRYEVTDSRVEAHWTGFYSGPLQDFQEVIERGQKTGRPNVAAMGEVMQSWTFQVVTDLWGDAGFSEALRGRDASAGLTVRYDPQQQIYQGLLADLKAASAAIQPGAPALGNADLIYGGNAARWRLFANSLRLRVAMRMSDADPARARTEFAAALSDGVFGSNADNAMLRYVDNGVNVNPIFAYDRSRPVDHNISATLVNRLKGLSDPRLPVYADKNKGGNYRGMPNGSMEAISLDSLSRIGVAFRSANSPLVLMSYAEVLFLQAEAAQRGWTAGDAAALYRQAITASMLQHGIPQAQISAYLAQPSVAYAGLPSIGMQKWIALYGNGPEAYAEWRRLGHPALTAGPDALNDGKIPVRLPYPGLEGSLNKANLQEAISRQGGAGLNDRVWWDRS